MNFVDKIGWLAVNLVLFVMDLQEILPLSYHSALFLIRVATLLVAVFGYNFIHTFAHWMSIVMGVLFIIVTAIAVKNLSVILVTSAQHTCGFSAGMFILAIAVAFSYQISYCLIGSGYSRCLPQNISKKKVWLSSYLGSLAVCIWLGILGALTASLGMHAGSMEIICKLMGFFAVPAIITVILSIFPVNAIAIYSSGLAMLAMGVPMKRWASVLLTGVLGALLVSFGHGGLANTYKNFLLLLSCWIAPWLAVVLCDFFSPKRLPGAEKNIMSGWAGIVSFICGVAVSIPFMNSVLYVGPLAKNYLGGADISYFLSMLVSAAVYWALLRFGAATEPAVLNVSSRCLCEEEA